MTLVAISDSAQAPIHGFLVALCLPDEWEVENIVVQQEFRRSGVGSSLVRGLLAEARNAGATSVLLEVRKSNLPARLLYEKIGFRLEGWRRDYYRNPLEDALLFRFPLQSYDKIA
jgi:[ribosomal protein S18]-alanine N-acetyltransferase